MRSSATARRFSSGDGSPRSRRRAASTRGRGWLPQHLALFDDGGRLVGACPLYVKGHSQGEFVFDHGWAQAAQRAGIRVLPEAAGRDAVHAGDGRAFPRAPGGDRAGGRAGSSAAALARALRRGRATRRCTSTSADPTRPTRSTALGYVRRAGYQFQWINPGWRTFDDYLAALPQQAPQPGPARAARARRAQGIEISVHARRRHPRRALRADVRALPHDGRQVLLGPPVPERRALRPAARRWKHRLAFVVARRGGEILAGTFNVRKGDVLYGRYWGAFEDVRHLHFNVCYYAAIELLPARTASRASSPAPAASSSTCAASTPARR